MLMRLSAVQAKDDHRSREYERAAHVFDEMHELLQRVEPYVPDDIWARVREVLNRVDEEGR